MPLALGGMLIVFTASIKPSDLRSRNVHIISGNRPWEGYEAQARDGRVAHGPDQVGTQPLLVQPSVRSP